MAHFRSASWHIFVRRAGEASIFSKCDAAFSGDVVASANSIGQKVGSGIGSTVLGRVLAAFGFVSSSVQPEFALNGIRFMPNAEGPWTYTVHSSDPSLDAQTGGFTCTPAAKCNHGRVCLKKDVVPAKEVNFYGAEDDYRFAYEDGTRFQPFGTTCCHRRTGRRYFAAPL